MKKRPVIVDYTSIIIGSILLAFAIKNLYDPISLVTGGFSGISIIVKDLVGIPLWITNTVLNIPLFIFAIPRLGWKFVKRTLVGTITVSVALAFLPSVNLLEGDIMLTALFGGVVAGTGLGMVFIFQATTGGTDMLAALIRLKIRHKSLIEIMQVIDAFIVFAGITIFGIRQALYAIIAIFVASKVSDYIIEGFKFSKQVFIISNHADEIAHAVLTQLHRGVTALNAKGMYSNQEKHMLFCVVSVKQIVNLKEIVKSIDSCAFVIVSDAREVFGEGFIED